MKVLILTLDTRGDVQPFVALPRGLANAGHEAVLAARGRPKLHIFLSCPNGIGVLLGHLWNRVPATQLYDDANSPEGYFPTFLLAS